MQGQAFSAGTAAALHALLFKRVAANIASSSAAPARLIPAEPT
jgi:hypothetical protein